MHKLVFALILLNRALADPVLPYFVHQEKLNREIQQYNALKDFEASRLGRFCASRIPPCIGGVICGGLLGGVGFLTSGLTPGKSFEEQKSFGIAS